MPVPEDSPLSLVGKLYQESIWDDVVKIGHGLSLERPLVVELDTTSFCDLACPECISISVLNETRFTTDRLISLTEEMIELGVRAVILIGGGEPLLHAAAGKVLKLLGQAGLHVGVTTNGTMIHRHLDALAENATWTRVSVDAASASCYASFRPSRSGRNVFDLVIENMRLLAQKKRGVLGYSYLLLARQDGGGVIEHNFAEVLAAGLLAKEIECDYFEVKPSYDMAHYLIQQPAGLLDLLTGQLSSLSQIEDSTFRVIAPRNLDVILCQQPTVEIKEYDRCYVSESRTLITSKGAYVCPYHRGDERWRYGNAANTSLRALWSDTERTKVMARLNPSEHCQFHCIRHATNQELIKIGKLSGRPELLPDFDLFL